MTSLPTSGAIMTSLPVGKTPQTYEKEGYDVTSGTVTSGAIMTSLPVGKNASNLWESGV